MIKFKADGCNHVFTGYGGGRPYLSMSDGYITDGIDRKHVRLFAVCDKCNQKIHVANTHLKMYGTDGKANGLA